LSWLDSSGGFGRPQYPQPGLSIFFFPLFQALVRQLFAAAAAFATAAAPDDAVLAATQGRGRVVQSRRGGQGHQGRRVAAAAASVGVRRLIGQIVGSAGRSLQNFDLGFRRSILGPRMFLFHSDFHPVTVGERTAVVGCCVTCVVLSAAAAVGCCDVSGTECSAVCPVARDVSGMKQSGVGRHRVNYLRRMVVAAFRRRNSSRAMGASCWPVVAVVWRLLLRLLRPLHDLRSYQVDRGGGGRGEASWRWRGSRPDGRGRLSEKGIRDGSGGHAQGPTGYGGGRRRLRRRHSRRRDLGRRHRHNGH